MPGSEQRRAAREGTRLRPVFRAVLLWFLAQCRVAADRNVENVSTAPEGGATTHGHHTVAVQLHSDGHVVHGHRTHAQGQTHHGHGHGHGHVQERGQGQAGQQQGHGHSHGHGRGQAQGQGRHLAKPDRVCCVNSVEPDSSGEPDVSLLKFAEQGPMKKCLLIGLPIACQATGKCVDECRGLVKNNLRWVEMVEFERKKVLEQIRTQSKSALESSEKAMQEAGVAAQNAEQEEVQTAELEYRNSVAGPNQACSEAQQAVADISEKVDDLRRQLEEAEKLKEAKTSHLQAQERLRDEARQAADEELRRAKEKAQAAREASKKAAEVLHTRAQEEAEEVVGAAQTKLDTISKRAEELRGGQANQQQANRGACAVGEGDAYGAVDCCCSVHEPDGKTAGTAMRVKGQNFISWDVCFGARKYADTSFSGWPCNWFGHCDKCETLICHNDRGQLVDCP